MNAAPARVLIVDHDERTPQFLADALGVARFRVRTSATGQDALAAAVRAKSDELIGRSEPMQSLQKRIDLVAAAHCPVLIQGETGTGKELVARAIHARSSRHRQPFISVNAAAIPEPLLESEMFGHVRGAFTGATQAHRGYFARAEGGTLLLDEIGDMPLPLQAKLLRVLQTNEVQPVGSERVERVNVRIIAATHRRLSALVKNGEFREDLYYRLNVVALNVPALRERPGDIDELASSFLARARARAPHARALSIRADLKQQLLQRPWPGNVRQLESAIERLVVLSQDAELTPAHLALIDDDEPLPDVEAQADEWCTVDSLVQRHCAATLSRTGGNKAAAAKLLGIDVSTLYRWERKWCTCDERD